MKNRILNSYLDIFDLYQGERGDQAKSLAKCLEENFNFDYFEIIETGASHLDGCFGLYLAKIADDCGGIFSSVDIDPEILEKSKSTYFKFLPDFKINHHLGDSIEFLKKYDGNPNLVHLDSWDLDMKNPVPSMLHGWLEFEAIKEKMPSGSICVVDDNFLKGTHTFWNVSDLEGNLLYTEVIETTYDIVGKGSLIYHWSQKEDTDWDLIGDHYHPGKNVKLILKKR